MFRCEKCTQSAHRPTKVVIERKMVDHLPKGEVRGPRGGSGSQIVKEISICSECVASVTEAPIERAELVPELKKVTFSVSLGEHAAT